MLSTRTSPKQPQLDTPSVTARNRVSPVIKIMSSNESQVESLRRMPNKRQVPSVNSSTATPVPSIRRMMLGKISAKPKAMKYLESCTYHQWGRQVSQNLRIQKVLPIKNERYWQPPSLLYVGFYSPNSSLIMPNTA